MIKVLCIVISLVALEVSGQGLMLDPPNRSSLWRFDSTALQNFFDYDLSCGGFDVQWRDNGGRCGVCGDDYGIAHPQDNENTGYYGSGKIVATYKSGDVITTTVQLIANKLGYFQYHLCPLRDSSKPELYESCFKLLSLEDGSEKYQLSHNMYKIYNQVQLPKGFRCEHCTLRWTYITGNREGVCADGTVKPGCGPQETFRSCADIKIINVF